MAFLIKMDRIGFLSLTIACFLLELLDLLTNIYIFTTILDHVRKSSDWSSKCLLILAGTGIWSCVFVIFGSIQENRGSIRSHILRQTFLLVVYLITGLVLLVYYFLGDHTIDPIKMVAFMICIPVSYFFYWNVLYNRFLQMKGKPSTSPSRTKGVKCCLHQHKNKSEKQSLGSSQ